MDAPTLTLGSQIPSAERVFINCFPLCLDGDHVGLMTKEGAAAIEALLPVSKLQIDQHLALWRKAGSPVPATAKRPTAKRPTTWRPVQRQTAGGVWVTFTPHAHVPNDALFYGVRLVPIDSIVPPPPETEDVPFAEAVGRTLPGRPLPMARIWVDPTLDALVWSPSPPESPDRARLPLNPDGTVTVIKES